MIKIILLILTLSLTGCITSDMGVVKIFNDRIGNLESEVVKVKDYIKQQQIKECPADYLRYLELKKKFEIEGNE